MLELDQNCKTKLDLSNMEHFKVAALHKVDVLMIDEVDQAYTSILTLGTL